ncbi:MAG: DUF167 domain-containing protein [Thaumarchaeota archaeon]|nr:DUF167 domain-containing protein [Nitrososphaerota archaeon]
MLFKVEVSFNKDYIKVEDAKIEIGIMSRPQGGKANLELIKKIAKHFGIPQSGVSLVSGHRSRDKVVSVSF